MGLFSGKKEQEEYISRLEGEITVLKTREKDLESQLVKLGAMEVFERQKMIDSLQARISQLKKDEVDINASIYEKKKEVIILDEEVLIQSFGMFKPKYAFANSTLYKDRLTEVRQQQKEMVKDKTAATGSTTWTINGSKTEGNKMVRDMVKLILRAFNSECDETVDRVKHSNYEVSKKRIQKSYDDIRVLGIVMNIQLSPKYLKLKLDELDLAFEFQVKKQEEKEELRRLKEEERDKRKAMEEIEAAKKRLEKEQAHFEQEISHVRARLKNATGEEASKLAEKLAGLEEKSEAIDAKFKDLDYREANNKAGYVYIISNIGAFGEDVYKIGMTRRLEPHERIDELGDASVPFWFDVHAMIFADDAPKLENALHRAFEKKRLNMVNARREFFNVTIEEIEEVIKANFDKTVELTYVPEADQYRESQILRSKA